MTTETTNTAETPETPVLPEILTANVYYWRPGSSARQRRANEERRHMEVQRFLDTYGDILDANGIEVIFRYHESCNHVYKRLEVYQNGVKKDIRALKKALGIK